ncbi:hypothetical protein Tco_0685771 [Tanacetum coccineum]
MTPYQTIFGRLQLSQLFTLLKGSLTRATIDTLEYTITEASVQSKLQLADASGISMLPNTEIFEGMGNMGYPADGHEMEDVLKRDIGSTPDSRMKDARKFLLTGIDKECAREKSLPMKTLQRRLVELVYQRKEDLAEKDLKQEELKRYGKELQTEISKKQRIDVSDTEEKVGKVKEEELVKRVGKRKKQKARKRYKY